MLDTILRIGPPIILIVGMIGVGMSMTRESLGGVASRPVRLAVVLAAQMVLLPCLGVLTVLATDPPMEVLTAMLLIAACPGGGVSNIYVLYARANVSLSVAMTVASLLLASVTIPVTVAVISWLGFKTAVSDVPPGLLAVQLGGVILAPVGIGMLIGRFAPVFAATWRERLSRLSAMMVLAILVAILWIERAAVAGAIGEILPIVLLFTLAALVMGGVVGRLVYDDAADRFAVTTEFAVRNLAIGAFLALSLGDGTAFAGPAAVYLLIEAALILALGFGRRRRLAASRAAT